MGIETSIQKSQSQTYSVIERDRNKLEKLATILSQDLDFHSQDSGYASHNFHSFPAKFPPQLPRKFINEFTVQGDVVLDPMMGSGTTVLEAYLSGRKGIGFDIDPLALLLTRAKTTPLNVKLVTEVGKSILKKAQRAALERRDELLVELKKRWDGKTKDFIDYWFAEETQIDLLALIREIEKIEDKKLRTFFELSFSAIIITKSGGVSLSFDLAHTRPHRAKVVFGTSGEILTGNDLMRSDSHRVKLLTKKLRSPFKEFEKRIEINSRGLLVSKTERIQPYLDVLLEFEPERIEPIVELGNAQDIHLADESVDLIVTSPPYASNAIDYMRAHKFSLVWLGYPIDDLGKKRKDYIGGEEVTGFDYVNLPRGAQQNVSEIFNLDARKGRVLHRYFTEMTCTLKEMYRVLRPGRIAIVVVGNTNLRGKNTETQNCLAEIGQSIGFQTTMIGTRNLDRNRRMMPAGSIRDLKSQIQQRMHEEYVIGFFKSEA
ncbi:MAG: site-specific DNA-methyltransferase [Anaerolineaceae bacterium]|nr:site-specific DNA-methyltransferase [Anaerolineaceae bacterium]